MHLSIMISANVKKNEIFRTDSVIDRYSQYLTENIKDSVEEVLLFGSRARGDYREDSDYDFAVLVNGSDKKQIRDIVLDAEVLILDEFNKMATSLIYTLDEWETKKKYPIGKNIISDGIIIWKKKE